MPFASGAQTVEAAKCEAQRAAEQHKREAKAAKKVLLQAACGKIKAEKQAKTATPARIGTTASATVRPSSTQATAPPNPRCAVLDDLYRSRPRNVHI